MGPQVDAHLQKLRKIGQESRHAGCGQVYSNMMRLKQEMEAERKLSQEAVMHAKQREREAMARQRQLEMALIEVAEASKAAWHEADRQGREKEEKLVETSTALAQVSAESEAAQARVQQLEGDFIRAQQKVGNSDVQVNEFEQRAIAMLNSFEPIPTPRSRLSAFTLKHLSPYSQPRKTPSVSGLSTEEGVAMGEANHEQMKEELREIFGEQAYRLRNALRSHNHFSSEVKKVVQNMKDTSGELASKADDYADLKPPHGAKSLKMAKEKAKRKRSHELTAPCTIVGMIDGWKETKVSNGSLQFWYNERTRTVAFSPPRERDSSARQGDHRMEAMMIANDLNTATDCDALTQVFLQYAVFTQHSTFHVHKSFLPSFLPFGGGRHRQKPLLLPVAFFGTKCETIPLFATVSTSLRDVPLSVGIFQLAGRPFSPTRFWPTATC